MNKETAAEIAPTINGIIFVGMFSSSKYSSNAVSAVIKNIESIIPKIQATIIPKSKDLNFPILLYVINNYTNY